MSENQQKYVEVPASKASEMKFLMDDMQVITPYDRYADIYNGGYVPKEDLMARQKVVIMAGSGHANVLGGSHYILPDYQANTFKLFSGKKDLVEYLYPDLLAQNKSGDLSKNAPVEARAVEYWLKNASVAEWLKYDADGTMNREKDGHLTSDLLQNGGQDVTIRSFGIDNRYTKEGTNEKMKVIPDALREEIENAGSDATWTSEKVMKFAGIVDRCAALLSHDKDGNRTLQHGTSNVEATVTDAGGNKANNRGVFDTAHAGRNSVMRAGLSDESENYLMHEAGRVYRARQEDRERVQTSYLAMFEKTNEKPVEEDNVGL